MTSKVQPGSIVLFHNAALHTPEALPGIIEILLQEGYAFVLIPEIILDTPLTTPDGRVWRADLEQDKRKLGSSLFDEEPSFFGSAGIPQIPYGKR